MQTQMNIPVHTKEQARTQPRTPAPDCEKRGYLEGDFRLFHLEDTAGEPIGYHYHGFVKIILFIKGSVEYIIEGRSYRLEPYDIVLVNHHDIHQPKINPAMPYERIIVYLSPSFISSWSGEGYDLNACFLRAGEFGGGVLRIRGLKNSRMFQAIERLGVALPAERLRRGSLPPASVSGIYGPFKPGSAQPARGVRTPPAPQPEGAGDHGIHSQPSHRGYFRGPAG